MSKELETAKKIFRETKNTEVANALLSVFGSKLVELKFNPDAIKWVDLGLPSGRLWASENVDGYYTYDQAVELFGDYLPKGVAFAELIEECKVEWNPNAKGLDVTGPNGNSIFLPAAGRIQDRGKTEVRISVYSWSNSLSKAFPNRPSLAGSISRSQVKDAVVPYRDEGCTVRAVYVR